MPSDVIFYYCDPTKMSLVFRRLEERMLQKYWYLYMIGTDMAVSLQTEVVINDQFPFIFLR